MRPPARIKVMADYGCDPLWFMGGDDVGCFSPREIGLPDDLSAALENWAVAFDGAIDWNDPANGPGWSEAQFEAHAQEGRALAKRLAGTLARAGHDAHVFYQSGGAIEAIG